MLRQHLILLSFGIVALSALQADGIESVRLCGRRLADALSVVCKTYGGYQLPRVRKDVSNRSSNKRAMIEILRPMMRRTTHSEIENDFSGDSATEVDLTPSSQSGVANECCKRPCTLRTMASYCADATDIGNLDINEIWRPEVVSEEDLAEYELQQEPIASSIEPAASKNPNQEPFSSNEIGYSRRPNLGFAIRNKTILIIFESKAPNYNGEKAVGEYRF
ncbi:uncharacterized protein LOC118185031 isoform X1 [Stegodyphus dumicola]|uniref:uncharacterized protein LOC118185031 isoform X1 n=1 Tax=Stegodyphus dumicola TaxID=202533 RepID=UPI0015B235ED|nr:uncharacterized protein LOC118185031 isoform X1 [Stegodyphus dumicola]